jgi:hypothetical protein
MIGWWKLYHTDPNTEAHLRTSFYRLNWSKLMWRKARVTSNWLEQCCVGLPMLPWGRWKFNPPTLSTSLRSAGDERTLNLWSSLSMMSESFKIFQVNLDVTSWVKLCHHRRISGPSGPVLFETKMGIMGRMGFARWRTSGNLHGFWCAFLSWDKMRQNETQSVWRN